MQVMITTTTMMMMMVVTVIGVSNEVRKATERCEAGLEMEG